MTKQFDKTQTNKTFTVNPSIYSLTNTNQKNKSNELKLLEVIFGEVQAVNFFDKINVIDDSNINILNDSIVSMTSTIFSDNFSEMYRNFVLVRKIINSNSDFIKRYITVLSKIVHPNIQLFYGLLLDKEIKNEFEIFENASSNKGENEDQNYNSISIIRKTNVPPISLNTKKILSNLGIVLEYVNGVDIRNFRYLDFLTDKESLYVKLISIKRISETMSFLHNSGFPHLMLNGKNIKINYKILKNQNNKDIFKGCNYCESNLLKITEIGTFYQFSNQMQYTIETEKSYEFSFYSPYLIEALNNSKNDILSNLNNLKRNDLWSFGCIIFELFIGFNPFNKIPDNKKLTQMFSENFASNKGRVSFKQTIQNDDNSSKDTLNETNLFTSFFLSYHYEDLIEFKNSLLEMSSDSQKVNSFFKTFLNLISYATYGSKEYDFNIKKPYEQVNSFSELNEIIYDLLNQFKELFGDFSTNNEETHSDIPNKYKTFCNINLENFIDIIELEELIQINKKLATELDHKKDELNSKETEFKRMQLLINETTNTKKHSDVNSNKFQLKYYFFVGNSNSFIFVRDNFWENFYALDVLSFEELKSTIDIKNENLKVRKKISNQKDLCLFESIDELKKGYLKKENISVGNIDIENLIESLYLFKESALYFSCSKQALFITGGKIEYYMKENAENKDSLISNQKSITNTFSFISEETKGYNPLYKSKLNKSISILIDYNSKNSFKCGNIKSIGIFDNEKQSKMDFMSGEIGKMLIGRSNHSIIDIGDYLFIIGGDQSTKCEVFDLNNNYNFFLEELNTCHKNPILYWFDENLYSLNFNGLMNNLKQKYHQKNKKTANQGLRIRLNSTININDNEDDDSFGNSSKMNNPFLKKSTGNFLSPKKKVPSLIQRKSVNFGSLSKKLIDDDSNNNDSNSLYDSEEDDLNFIALESLYTGELASLPSWRIVKVNCDNLSLTEIIQFTNYKHFILQDTVYIIGMEKLDDLENTWIYLTKFNIIDNKFSSSKPIPANNKMNILKYSMNQRSNIIQDSSALYFFNSKSNKVEKLCFKDINL